MPLRHLLVMLLCLLSAVGCAENSKSSSPSESSSETGSVQAQTPTHSPSKAPTPLTVATLRSARMPALCGHRAGKLVRGELPGIPADQGFVRLRPDLVAIGDLSGDEADEALAVFECSAGGVGLAHQLVAFEATASGPHAVDDFDTWQRTHARDGVTRLEYRDRAVQVSSKKTLRGDALCCPSGQIEFTMRLQGDRLVATDSAPTSDATTTSGSLGPLEVGQTARLPYFDVTVTDHRTEGALWGGDVRVCYTRAHPDANPDGTTRISADPWQFGSLGSDGRVEYSKSPTIDTRTSDRWQPAYGEARLKVGQCHSGWVAISLAEAASGFRGMRYAPSSFNFSATWRW